MQVKIWTSPQHAARVNSPHGWATLNLDLDDWDAFERESLAQRLNHEGEYRDGRREPISVAPPTADGLRASVAEHADGLRRDALQRRAREEQDARELERSLLEPERLLTPAYNMHRWQLARLRDVGFDTDRTVDSRHPADAICDARNLELAELAAQRYLELGPETDYIEVHHHGKKFAGHPFKLGYYAGEPSPVIVQAHELQAQHEAARELERTQYLEARQARKREWIAAHGTERLRRCVEEGIEHEAIYRSEYLAHVLPAHESCAWERYREVPWTFETPRNPPLDAFELLDIARADAEACESLELDDDPPICYYRHNNEPGYCVSGDVDIPGIGKEPVVLVRD